MLAFCFAASADTIPGNNALPEIYLIPPAFLDALDQGAVAVTVNQRLSRVLTQQFDQRQARAGKKAWAAAQIMPWDAWLTSLYKHANMVGPKAWQLLSASQSASMWEQLVSEASTDIDLLDARGAAALAQEAWAIEQAWQPPSGSRASIDHHCYLKWAGRYRDQCQQRRWLDRASLAGWLCQHLEHLDSILPSTLLVIGFDTVSVAQQALFDALADRGTEIHLDDLAGQPRDNARVLACADERQEIRLATSWARKQLEEPGQRRIAIVVPDLQRLRDSLLTELHEALNPATALQSDTVQSSHYNISLGVPLSEYPMIADALRLLRLISHPQPRDLCAGLVLSAYIAGADQEREARAIADLELREQQRSTFSFPSLASVLRRTEGVDLGNLSELLDQTISTVDSLPKRQSHADWSRAISGILQTMGWPGDRVLNSEEFQLHGAWQQTIQALAEFDLVAGACTFPEAVRKLATLMKNNIFQLESAADARLQIVGLLEVVGMEFDAMWVMGMDEYSWPQRSRPNPFLPVTSQRAADVPHNSAQWEQGFARRTINRFHAGSDDLTFSFSVQHDDTERGPSALLSHIPVISMMCDAGDDANTVPSLESVEDHFAPPLANDTTVRGGVRVLSDQADCPFRAFALHRLQVTERRESSAGISAQQQGSLLHTAMEVLWRDLASHAELVATDRAALTEKIDVAIETAFSNLRLSLDSAILTIEREHLRRLIDSWLEVEKQRSGFHVELMEEQRRLSIGGLNLSLRIDRADRLESGERLLIDYKTGNPKHAPSLTSLLESRSSEVQLPLYALAEGDDVSAVALAFVRPLQSQFKGLSDEGFTENNIDGIRAFNKSRSQAFDSWDEVRAFWADELNSLAREFVDGVATVTPKNSAVTCQYCTLSPLCRIGSARQSDENV